MPDSPPASPTPGSDDVRVVLKPCPFCNGPAVNVAGEYITCGAPAFLSCAGRSVRADADDWNTRATPSDLSAARAEGRREGLEEAAVIAETLTYAAENHPARIARAIRVISSPTGDAQ